MAEIKTDVFSLEDVDNAVHCLRAGKAAGIDRLTAEHILFSHPSLIIHLHRLFNLLMKHGCVPSQFGQGIVIPLVKDKHGNLSDSDNYRGITVSCVISKLFEHCLMNKYGLYLYSSDLQFGFKKQLGCSPPLFILQQVVKYFTSRGSTVYVTAVDASKAFDRLDHRILFDKLIRRNIPYCFVAILRDWYSKLTSVVRWNGILSTSFAVTCGVRQGGILSPFLFNVYVNELIELLRDSGYGCYVNSMFIGCLMYADDLLLLSPTVGGIQALLHICDSYGSSNNIVFNTKKTCSVVGNAMNNDVLLLLNNQTSCC